MSERDEQVARDDFNTFATQVALSSCNTNLCACVMPLPFEVVGPDGVLKLGDVLLGGLSDTELGVQDVIAEQWPAIGLQQQIGLTPS